MYAQESAHLLQGDNPNSIIIQKVLLEYLLIEEYLKGHITQSTVTISIVVVNLPISAKETSYSYSELCPPIPTNLFCHRLSPTTKKALQQRRTLL